MAEVTITPVPLNLGETLGEPSTGNSVSRWRIQNRGPSTIYRTVGVSAPDPAAVRGFRHASGSIVEVSLLSDTPTWLWCSAALGATLIVEVA